MTSVLVYSGNQILCKVEPCTPTCFCGSGADTYFSKAAETIYNGSRDFIQNYSLSPCPLHDKNLPLPLRSCPFHLLLEGWSGF